MLFDSVSARELPLLSLPFGTRGGSAVMVSARGLWTRTVRPRSPAAVLRALQLTVPCVVRLRENDVGREGAPSLDELAGALARGLADGRPAIAVPLLVEVDSPNTAARLFAGEAAALWERLPGCRFVLRWPAASRHALHPVVDAAELRRARGSGDEVAAWAWRIPIEVLVGESAGAPLEASLAALGARRIVVDSADVLTTVADARAWPPSREIERLDRLVSALPSIDVWRVSDLLESEFLAHCATRPFA